MKEGKMNLTETKRYKNPIGVLTGIFFGSLIALSIASLLFAMYMERERMQEQIFAFLITSLLVLGCIAGFAAIIVRYDRGERICHYLALSLS